MTNKELIEKYPFIAIKDESDNPIEDYTLLDDMPEGWKIAFGEQLCEEIQQEIDRFEKANNTKVDYKVVQVKEKYGSLRWYDNGNPRVLEEKPTKVIIDKEDQLLWTGLLKEYPPEQYSIHYDSNNTYRVYKIVDQCDINSIINKYEDISARTCIVCGKPATKESQGWICPYCDEHAPEKSIDINEFLEKWGE